MLKESYDFIIVGGGSAGCVLANRLSEQHSVLLLEAGEEDKAEKLQAPDAWPELLESPYDWNFKTEAEQSLKGRAIAWPRGKVLGGSSSINAMVYVRGHKSDFDAWEGLGCEGWSYDEVLPFFKNLEDYKQGSSFFHGVGGYLGVSDLPKPHPFTEAFLEAAAELGFDRNQDFNAEEQWGAGLHQRTVREGLRESSSKAFLAPVWQRANLHIQTAAFVRKILFEGKLAIGVEFDCKGKHFQVEAKREVILSAGAIQSPQLLLLSGIGPAKDLEALGIPVVEDLTGVGANLQDHPSAVVRFWAKDYQSVASESHRVEGGLFCNTVIESKEGAPELQLNFVPEDYAAQRSAGNKTSFTLAILMSRPFSRGSVCLRSTNPYDHPIINANYYDDPRDMKVMIAGLKIVKALRKTRALGLIKDHEYLPGESVQTDEAIEAYIREKGDTAWHPVGSCKMGVEKDAVVDPQLRVKGIKQLRVVDASIMPIIVTGNTNAATLMIAEKASQMILNASA